MTARRITTIAGDVGTDGLGLVRRRPRRARLVRHRHPLGRHGVVRLAARLGRRDQPARPDAHRRPAQRARRHAPPRRPCRRATSPATAAARRPRSSSAPGPFDLGLSWRAEVAAARRLRGDAEAASRQPDQLAEFRAEARTELGAAGAPALAAKTEQLPRALGARPPRRGRPGPRRQRRLARRLRVHQGARRAGADRDSKGDVPGQHRAPVDHRVGVGRAAARAGSAASAWPSRCIISYARGLLQRVPRRARGHRRRDPRRPRRRRDHRRRRPRARTQAPRDHPGRVRRHQPAASTARSSTTSAAGSREHPLYDSEGQPIVVPELPLPRPRPRAGPARPGPRR